MRARPGGERSPRLTATLAKIVSGGQTGVDRGALDAALDARFPCGGWCPEGRIAEDGFIAPRYPLVELAGGDYAGRTLTVVGCSIHYLNLVIALVMYLLVHVLLYHCYYLIVITPRMLISEI